MTTDDGHGVPQSFGGTSEGLVSGRRVHCQLDDFRRPMKAALGNYLFARAFGVRAEALDATESR